MDWRLLSRRAAWVCVAIYLYMGFIAYPAKRSGGQWDFLHDAPGWAIGLAIACFFGSWILFALGGPRVVKPTSESTTEDSDRPSDS